MTRPILFGVVAVPLLLAALGWRMAESSWSAPPVELKARPPQAAPLCPWREPQADLKLFFLDATGHEVETRVLSGLRQELARRLGRALEPDENALHVVRIRREDVPLGTILVRRVKGAHGAIELVLAVDANEQVRGVRLQRLREPEPAARALQDPEWLRSFAGKRAESSWQLGVDIPEVPPEARTSAQAVVEGARSLLILLAAAGQAQAPGSAAAPHH